MVLDLTPGAPEITTGNGAICSGHERVCGGWVHQLAQTAKRGRSFGRIIRISGQVA